jgi:hypothetical protein
MQVRDKPRIIDTGVYGIVRHPLYSYVINNCINACIKLTTSVGLNLHIQLRTLRPGSIRWCHVELLTPSLRCSCCCGIRCEDPH